MTLHNLQTVQTIINHSSTLQINNREVIYHPGYEFFEILKHTLNAASEHLDDRYLNSFLRPVRNYAFLFPRYIFPINHELLFPAESLTKFKLEKDLLESRYPNLILQLEQLFEALAILQLEEEAPLLQTLLDLTQEEFTNNAILVYPNNYLKQKVKEYISGPAFSVLQQYQVVTPVDLKTWDLYDRLIVLGKISDFPNYIYDSPRTDKIEILKYSWVNDRLASQDGFINPVHPHKPLKEKIITIKTKEESAHKEISITSFDLKEFAPKLNVHEVAKVNQGNINDESETVKAKLIVFSNNKGVFLERDSNIDVVFPETDHPSVVSKCEVSNLNIGNYIVLRIGGGGDYIVEIANQQMGMVNAMKHRNRQRTWKKKLNDYIKVKGIKLTQERLSLVGVKSASKQNIRNWCSSRSLGLYSEQDFKNLLLFLEIEDIDSYIKTIKILRSEHLSAGSYLSKKLVAKIHSTNLNRLIDEGHFEVGFDELSDAKLSINYVEEVSNEIIEVSLKLVGKLINVGV